LLGWIVSVPLDIWWPRKISPEHPALARSFGLVRWTAGVHLLAYSLFMAVLLHLAGGMMGWLEAATLAVSGGAMMLSPLAACASALDVQRRSLALGGCYGAALLAAGQIWFSLYLWLYTASPISPVPWWCMPAAVLSAALAAIALALTLELYTLTRRPSTPR
jgi:hypothetical protein